MSQTRIICERCGFVQIHCTCKPMTPDHQLARSTAEKIHLMTGITPRGKDIVDRTEALILASYHERDRAATAPHPLQSIIDGKRTPPDIDRAISDNLMALVEPAATAMGGETDTARLDKLNRYFWQGKTFRHLGLSATLTKFSLLRARPQNAPGEYVDAEGRTLRELADNLKEIPNE